KVPEARNRKRVMDPIDNFILAKLEEKNLTLSDPADRRTFIRRATLGLWGIPPTYDDVQAFIADDRPDAVPLLIERLLASPRYGERWARHWLDIARYADSKGYVFTEESRYPYAYTYRDYVIEAFNEDKPYDRFLIEQIAADQVDLGGDVKDLAALGFLTVGRRFLNKQEDIIDDRIDVVTRGMMGLTVGCARCHDHKYDPIPTADYYSLYGVFNSSQEPGELPVIGESTAKAGFEKFEADLKQREQKVQEFQDKTRDKINAETRGKIAAYLTDVIKTGGRPSSERRRGPTVNGEPRPAIVRKWQEYLDKRPKDSDAIFGPWHKLAAIPAEQFAAAMTQWSEQVSTENAPAVHPLVKQTLLDKRPQTPLELATAYGELLTGIETKWQEHRKATPDATALPDADAEALRQVLYAEGAPTNLTTEECRNAYQRDERDKDRNLKKEIESLKATSPGAPPRAMVMNDKPQPVEPRIFIRGNQGRQGDQVPRQFLQVLAGPERKPFNKGSGRLELAQSVASPNNPLTARVIVNRVWQHHFGYGLVRTPGDFGIRGETPTHPELLDHLATRFINSGWSVKELHRWIMTSAAYGQASIDRPEARKVDPENRLYWAMPRQRLELEALRDSWLSVSGLLDEQMGGRPYDDITDPKGHRRTVYGMVNRNDLPGVFRVFDFADPDASAAQRPLTTVPQQALFAMNAPFVVEQSRVIAGRVKSLSEDNTERVIATYRQVLGRDPSSEEREQAVAFATQGPAEKDLGGWEQLAQVLLLTNEFCFVD
ncbi:MAG TPA: DUF1549 and DUF1553 domain-containing protein, partial [Planctomycetaceae bacterium]|nr:DUF1549 and DUF1553 domain-containing protein [Planctomycetaceae bacterium]